MKLLITGGDGFVGRNLVRKFSHGHLLTLTHWTADATLANSPNAEGISLDIRDADAVNRVIRNIRPDAVVHAAGNKNVKFCERNPDEAYRVNAEGVRNVARACREEGAQLVYLSTDLVFDSEAGGYSETDRPAPRSVYGQAKLAGEELAVSEAPDTAICRSAGIYGPASPLLKWVATELQEGRAVPCLTNVVNTPTWVDSLAEMLEVILARGLNGVFHTVGADPVNRYQLFSAFAEGFGFDSALLQPIESEPMMRDLLLWPNSSLDSDWTRRCLGLDGITVREGMRRFAAEWSRDFNLAGARES